MQAIEDDGRRVLKRQRVCADHIHHQLDLLLTEVETAKAQLVEKQDGYKRKRQRSQAAEQSAETSDHDARENSSSPASRANGNSPVRDVEKSDDEMDRIVLEFVERVKMLNLDKAAADELKGLHVALAKYGKQIDKLSSSDITKICRSKEPDHHVVCQLIAEYLYHDGQIVAADAVCKEANIELPSNYRACFVELRSMLEALKQKNMVPALEWSRSHREQLQRLHIDIEFELVRLKYLDLLESCTDVMEAVKLAGEELSLFHTTHKNDIGRLMTCVIYKGRFHESPYKDLFDANRWDHIREAVVRACCRLHQVPHRAYLDTCLSASVTALPAMRKLVNVMDSKLSDWDSMEELPVEIPVGSEHRFHTVFSCPVSKEESTPTNPPVLLKCGHVICKSCVKKISYNMSRRFKCPTCPVEQMESDTRELVF